MISKRDSKPFQIKFPIGIEKTNKLDMKYESDWHTCFGLVRETANGQRENPYGYNVLFDKLVTTNAGLLTRLIDEKTLFMVDDIPTSVFPNGNYSVERVFPEYNGEIVIGLTKKQDINIPKLYFSNAGKILYHQLNFDEETKKAYVPIKSIIPFKEGDYVWTREPINSEVVKNRLIFKSKEKFGVSSNMKNFYELTFVEG